MRQHTISDYEFDTEYLLSHLFKGALGRLNLPASHVSEDMSELSNHLNIKLEDIVLEMKPQSKHIIGKLKPSAYDKVLKYKIGQLFGAPLALTNSLNSNSSDKFNMETGRFEKSFRKIDILGQGAFGRVS